MECLSIMWFTSIFHPFRFHRKRSASETHYLLTETHYPTNRRKNNTLFTLFSQFLFGQILFEMVNRFFFLCLADWFLSALKCRQAYSPVSKAIKNCLKANKFFNTLPIYAFLRHFQPHGAGIGLLCSINNNDNNNKTSIQIVFVSLDRRKGLIFISLFFSLHVIKAIPFRTGEQTLTLSPDDGDDDDDKTVDFCCCRCHLPWKWTVKGGNTIKCGSQ